MSTQGGGGGGVGPNHVCTIIADSLMSTSNEMCGGFLVHTMSTASTIRYTCAYKFTARVKSRA